MRKRKSWAFWGRNRGHDNIVGTASSEAFTEHGVFWPKELLPRAIPHTRIFTWGYDVDVNNVFSAASQATVFQHAATLLSDIANKRTSSTEVCEIVLHIVLSLWGCLSLVHAANSSANLRNFAHLYSSHIVWEELLSRMYAFPECRHMFPKLTT